MTIRTGSLKPWRILGWRSIYRSLDHFDRLNLELQTWLYEAVKEQYGRTRLMPTTTSPIIILRSTLNEQEDFGLGRLIIVADKGLNCGDIARQLAIGNGYIYSQSIRGQTRNSPAPARMKLNFFHHGKER